MEDAKFSHMRTKQNIKKIKKLGKNVVKMGLIGQNNMIYIIILIFELFKKCLKWGVFRHKNMSKTGVF